MLFANGAVCYSLPVSSAGFQTILISPSYMVYSWLEMTAQFQSIIYWRTSYSISLKLIPLEKKRKENLENISLQIMSLYCFFFNFFLLMVS